MRLKNLALLRKSVETYGTVESESENATRFNTAKKLLKDIDDFLIGEILCTYYKNANARTSHCMHFRGLGAGI